MAELGSLEIVIVGHVDHGKSTLIGRLFLDTGMLPPEKYEEIRFSCERDGREFELAFLMDALEEEREQNVTIDTAQTYFKTAKRNYVIIDAPGHKEFLKNMLTGAAQADAALLLIDGEEGVREQTQRHAYVLSLLGIKQVIVLINKLDKVGFSERRFEQVRREANLFLHSLGITPSYTIPISARDGDNVANKSERTSWYDGQTVLEALDSFTEVRSPTHLPARFPIQDIYRWDDNRYYAGRLESGEIRVGDEIQINPLGRKAKVKSIEVWNAPARRSATAGESVALTFDQELFAERGAVVSHVAQATRLATEVTASIFWLGAQPLEVGQTLQFKLATAAVEARVIAVDERLDSSSLAVVERHAERLESTEAGTVRLTFRKPLALDQYDENPRLGRFVLVVDGIVRGGGTILEARAESNASSPVVRLDDRLVQGSEGEYVDLTHQPALFEVDASESFLSRVERGDRVLLKLRVAEQVTALTRLAFEQRLDYHFHRATDGSIEVLLYNPAPKVEANQAGFMI